jgi:hypothetical protein
MRFISALILAWPKYLVCGHAVCIGFRAYRQYPKHWAQFEAYLGEEVACLSKKSATTMLFFFKAANVDLRATIQPQSYSQHPGD